MPGIHGNDLVDPPEVTRSPRALGGGASGSRLRGRRSECEVLDRLVANVRSGQSQVLVLRGEAGTGKTALLDYLVRRAAGCRIARIAGAEPEMEMAFAGLHQLCGPFLDRLGRLPGPQCDALRTAFNMRDGDVPGRFAVGLATLSVLSEAAEARPLVCLVDDAQWLDRSSAQALAFVARHLPGAPIAVVSAVRQPDGQQDLTGLPELPVGGLAESDARALLDSIVIGPLDERVRNRIVAETRGNPQALLEVRRGLTSAELAGGFGRPSGLTLPRRIEESYRRRLTSLPPATRLLLLIAAAEPAGDPVLVWRAAGYLGIEAGAAAPAAAAGLVEFSGRVRFCDPHARAAIYQAAPPGQRQSVHRALAEATDPVVHPDQRAWHRAHASSRPDEDAAAELERSASHARTRGGLAAAAAFCERAAELTPEPGRRAHRALEAAQTSHEAGALDAALGLLAMAQAGPLDELGHARAELLRAQMAINPDRGLLLLKAAERLEPLDAELAREAYRGAFDAALTAGRLEPRGGTRRVAEAVQAAPPAPRLSGAPGLLLDGLAALAIEGPATGAPMLRQALIAARDKEASSEQALRWLPFACRMSQMVWDDESWDELSTRLIELARRVGALTVLPDALAEGVVVRLAAGELTTAAAMTHEAEAVVRAAGSPVGVQYGPALIAAWRGQQVEAPQLIAAATTEMAARGEGRWLTAAAWATAVLYNGLGRYDEALAAAEQGSADPDELGLATWALVELIEAAARTGSPDRAADALRRLSESTSAAATNWALGIQARSTALLSESESAEQLYREAIGRLGRTRIRTELARAHLLYGEWLRRQGRRGDAREQLRSAHEMLDAMGIAGFAERARRELAAAGEAVRKRTIETTAELTAQEAQIARLATAGHSNPEISTQLYISPRTVEWHLRKVFSKLGISCRKELRAALSDLDGVPLSA